MSGNFLSCSKGVKDPLEVPEFKCDYPLLASAEMGVISSGGENLLDFLELRQVLSTYEGASDIRSGGLRKGQSPWELLGGLSGFLFRRSWGLRPCVDSVPEPEDSSPVQTWILGVLLDSPQGSQSSSRVGAWTCAFLPSCSSSVALPFAWIKGSVSFPRGFPTRLSHEAFPRGFPKRLSHEAFPQGCPTCHHVVSRSSA